MLRLATLTGAVGISLLLAVNASAYFTQTAAPAQVDVTLFATHFEPIPGVCTVGLGGSGIPTEKVGWLGRPDAVEHPPSGPFRTALAAHGRFYRPHRYRANAVYFAQPPWRGGAALEADLDRGNLDMFVQVLATANDDCRFRFQLMFDLDAKELPDTVDLVALLEVDVQDAEATPFRLPYGAGLNPALPASFGAIQHAMAAAKGDMGKYGNGIGWGLSGLGAGFGGTAAAVDGDALNAGLSEPYYDLHNGANQQTPTGWDTIQHAPEPSSLAVFGGLSLLAVCGNALRKRNRKRKPA